VWCNPAVISLVEAWRHLLYRSGDILCARLWMRSDGGRYYCTADLGGVSGCPISYTLLRAEQRKRWRIVFLSSVCHLIGIYTLLSASLDTLYTPSKKGHRWPFPIRERTPDRASDCPVAKPSGNMRPPGTWSARAAVSFCLEYLRGEQSGWRRGQGTSARAYLQTL